MTEDHVRLNDVVFFAHLGVSDAEREVGQRIHIDVDLQVNLERASHTDDLHDTVNYESVYRELSRVVEGSQHRLMESLAGALAEALLKGFAASQVRIRVRKPNVPFAGSLSSAEIELVRRR